MSTKIKTLSFDEFKEGLLEQIEFSNALDTLKWLLADTKDNKALQIGIIKEMYKRYIALNKKFETDPNRISSGRVSRRLS